MSATSIIFAFHLLFYFCYGWYPGNPFGNLPNPKASYLMNLSTAAWFVGNDTGMNNINELNAEAKYGTIGIGWEINNKNSNCTHEDKWDEQTAIALKNINPNILTLAPRETECVGVAFDVIRNAIESNKYELFLTYPNNSTKIYTFPWHGKGYTFPSAWPNFLSNNSINWFLNNWIEPAIKNDNFDGIYWDGCGVKPTNILSTQQFAEWNAGSQLFYSKSVDLLKQYNKWSMSWWGYFFDATWSGMTPTQCSKQINSYINIGNNSELNFLFVYNYQKVGQYDSGLWLAIFLIARGKSATLMQSVKGAYDYASVGYTFDQRWSVDYGVPQTQGKEIETNIFFRSWTKANITFNCSDLTYKIAVI
eukprot:319514_1